MRELSASLSESYVAETNWVRVERPMTFTTGRTTLTRFVHPYNEETEEESMSDSRKVVYYAMERVI